MMFSATSLTDARSAAGSAVCGSVPLIGLDVTASPARRRNNSGDSDATAPHSPATIRRPGGGSAFHGVGEEVDRRAVEPARELRAHARLVHLTCGDRVQALRARPAVGLTVCVAPADVEGRSAAGVSQRIGHPVGKRLHRKGFRTTTCPSLSWRSTQSRPAARRLGNARTVVRRRRHRDRTGSRTSRRRPRRRPRHRAARRTRQRYTTGDSRRPTVR